MSALPTPPDCPLADVKWRVDSKPTNGRARFIPYINAEVLATLLDEWVGPECWSDRYEQAHGKGLWCHLSVKVGDEWVTKTDIGVPSNMEAEKGQVSDAFKRAGALKWGVGRNVYRLPNVWAPVDEKANRNGEKVAYPNKQTIPAIIDELKKQGFTDAAASEATSDEDLGGGESTPTGAPAATTAPSSDAATFDEHDWLRKEIAALSPDEKKSLVAWWKQHGLPSITDKDVLTAGQFESVTSYLDELHEMRERVSNDPNDLAARAQALADKAKAPKGKDAAMAAAGEGRE